MSDDAKARRRLPLRKRLTFLLVLVLAALLGGELVARAAGFPRGLVRSTNRLWATDAERALGPFSPGARATIAWPPELEFSMEIDALGVRGPAPVAGRPVVLCVGDSTTFGANVAEAETYPAALERHLAAAGLSASVVNGGCPRWTITDEDEFLARALPALRPRVVVLLFCGNDLMELDKPAAVERVREEAGTAEGVHLALPEALMWGTLLGKRAWLRARGQWPPELRADQGETGAWAVPYWSRYAEALGRFAARCRAAGAPLVMAAFPGFKELEAPTCPIEQTLPGLARGAGAEWVDLHAAFRASPEGRFLLPYDAHASASGNDLIARQVAEPVRRLVAAGAGR